MNINRILESLISLSRLYKRMVQISIDLLMLSASLLIYGFLALPENSVDELWLPWAILALSYPLCSSLLRVYSAVLRFITPSIIVRLALASFISVSILEIWSDQQQSNFPERFFVDLGALITLGALLPRMLFAQLVRWNDRKRAVKVAIYGAGAAGRQLMSALQADSDYRVLGFIDDDPELRGALIQGLPVYALEDVPMLLGKGLEEVQLAIPRATRARRKEVLLTLESNGLSVRTIPSINEILSGRAKLEELRAVSAEDLLGRDPVPPVHTLMEKNIRDKAILVSGAGGTIGSQICREILERRPRRLVLFEANEYALYEIEMELRDALSERGLTIDLVPVLGSVCHSGLLRKYLKDFSIETIYHAAAYKHVPLVEVNAVQGVKNNALGTWAMAKVACESGVESFVLVSTDKAVRPPNIMGASKRLAELAVQALADTPQCAGCTFSIVRFGNVMDSSGSVIPRFRRQIAAGGPVTVTHRDMTRYFMTVEEAAQLVIQAGAMASSGEVYVLDMGEPVNIYDLAIKKIRLHGFVPRTASSPDGDIEVRITGPRPGEKLEEELLISGALPTVHPRIFKANEPTMSYQAVSELMALLETVTETCDLSGLYALLEAYPAIGYQPQRSVSGNVISATALSANRSVAEYHGPEEENPPWKMAAD